MNLGDEFRIKVERFQDALAPGEAQKLIEDALFSNPAIKHAYTNGTLEQFANLVHQTFCSSTPCLYASIPLATRDTPGICKDKGMAEKVKAQAAKDFRDENFDDAAWSYTIALRQHPFKLKADREAASILHCNRALCLMKWKAPGDVLMLKSSPLLPKVI